MAKHCKRSSFIQPSNIETKLQLRKHFRYLRSQVEPAYKQKTAKTVANLLADQPLFLQSQHIACYLPAKEELDTSCILDLIWKANKQCYLPVVANTEAKELQFVEYHQSDALQLNQYSIAEPVNRDIVIKPSQLDIVIMPLVAFDLRGGRLGMGGGYYDRTFQFLRSSTDKKPKLIGLAYAAQQADLLPLDSWDMMLDGVLTEKGFIAFS